MTMQRFTAREYLKIDIANNYGLEKKSWRDRLDWFDANETQLLNLVNQAETPALFYAGVMAWQDMLAGKPTGYMISLDATSSGLQLLAALTGDASAASICNVTNSGKREDAYTAIYEAMLAVIGDTAKVSREQAKEAVMTSLYGSTAVPKRVFGEGQLLDVFFYTMQETAPAAWELNQAFLSMWDPTVYSHDWVLPDNFHVHIKVMDSIVDTVHFANQPFEVYRKVNRPTESGRSLGANTIHSIDGMIVREITRRCDYDPEQLRKIRNAIRRPAEMDATALDALYGSKKAKMCQKLWDHFQKSGYLSARILDYIDEQTINLVDPTEIVDLLASLPAKPFKVLSIHDCFRCHPNYGNDLREQYTLQLKLIAQSDLLSYLVSQILNRPITIGKLDHSLPQKIMSSDYALS